MSVKKPKAGTANPPAILHEPIAPRDCWRALHDQAGHMAVVEDPDLDRGVRRGFDHRRRYRRRIGAAVGDLACLFGAGLVLFAAMCVAPLLSLRDDRDERRPRLR